MAPANRAQTSTRDVSLARFAVEPIEPFHRLAFFFVLSNEGFPRQQVIFAFEVRLLDLIGELTFANLVDAIWE